MAVQQVRSPGGATEAKQNTIIAELSNLLTELQQKLETGQAVPLDAATIADLQTVTASISNFPTDYPDDAAAALLAGIKAVLEGTLTTNALTDAQLRATPVPVDIQDASITVEVAESVEISNDEGNPIPVTGTVDVGNFPTQTGLTDAQLRAAPVPVDIADATLTVEIPGEVEISNDDNNPIPVTVTSVSTTITAVGPLTDAQLRAASVDVSDSGEREYTHVVATVTASGDTTIHTPASGKAIRLRWIYAVNDPTSETAPLIKVKLGSTEIYRVYALSKRQLKTGAVNDALVINLSGTASVAVTAILEEI